MITGNEETAHFIAIDTPSLTLVTATVAPLTPDLGWKLQAQENIDIGEGPGGGNANVTVHDPLDIRGNRI